MAEEQNVIGIRFGVKGGTDINGDSGARIKTQLEAIANQIDLTVAVNVKAAKNGNNAITQSVKKQTEEYGNLKRQLEEIVKMESRLAKMAKKPDGSQATVEGALLESKITEKKNAYDEMYKSLKEVSKGQDEAAEKGKEQLRIVEQLAAQYEKLSKGQPAGTLTDLAKLGVKSQSLYTDNGFDKILARSPEALKRVDEFNDKVREALAKPEGITKTEVNKLNTEFLRVQETVKKLGAETNTFGNKVKKAFDDKVVQKFAENIWAFAAAALRYAYQEVARIDKAMTQLRIVTRATSGELEDAAEHLANTAKEIGASLTGLINSTTTYARLGYGLADAQVLAEKTAMYANISGVNVSEATTNITGLIKAFNVGADGLEKVLDQLIFVGNNFPVSQAEIGEAINNAGSALAANGNSLQQAIGIVTAANASLQDVSKASTAVRTIAARISRSTAELAELGEDAGSVYSTADLDALMSGFQVKIQDANGELRSTYEILSDLAEKWDDLGSTDKAAIVDALAGTRQQNAFYSIMDNWKEAESIVARESEGIGSLAKAQEAYLDSMEGRMQQLTATFESFARTLLESDLIKVGIQILNGFATGLDWISKWFPTTEALVGALGMAVATLGKRAIIGITGWIAKLKELKKEHNDTKDGIFAAYSAQNKEIEAAKAALEELNNVKPDSALGKALKSTGLTTEELTKQYADCNKQAYAMVNNLQTTYKLTEDGAKAMAQWAVESDQLNTRIQAATAAQARYMQTILNTIMGVSGVILTIASAIDNDFVKACAGAIVAVGALATVIVAAVNRVNKAIMANVIVASISLALSGVTMLWQAIKKLLPTYDNLKEKAQEARDEWKAAKDEIADTENKIKDLQQAIDELNAKGTLTFTEEADKERMEQELAYLKQIKNAQEGAITSAGNTAIKTAIEALKKYASDNGLGDISTQSLEAHREGDKVVIPTKERERIANAIKEYSELLSEFEYGQDPRIDAYFEQLYKMTDAYTMATEGIATAWETIQSRVKFKEAIKGLKEFANEYSNTSLITWDDLKRKADESPEIKELFDYLSQLGLWNGDWANPVELGNLIGLVRELRDGMVTLAAPSISDNIDAVTDKFEALSQALEDVRENGTLSTASLKTLAEKYPSLLRDIFTKTDDGAAYVLNGDYGDASDFDILQAVAGKDLEASLAKLNEYRDSLDPNSDDYQTALENYAKAQDELNQKVIAWAISLREAKIAEETKKLEANKDQLEDQLDTYKDLIDARKKLLQTYKEEVEYRKELNKKQQNVADLQTQLALAQLDNSAAGKARARDLQSQLQEAQDELDEFTLEKAIEDITNQMESEYDEYESFIEGLIDGISKEIQELAKNLKFTPEELSKALGEALNATTNTTYTSQEMDELRQDIEAKQKQGMAVSGKTQSFLEAAQHGNWAEADKNYNDAKEAVKDWKPPTTDTKTEETPAEKIAKEMTAIQGASGGGIDRKKKHDQGYINYNGYSYRFTNGGDQDDLVEAAYKVNKFPDRTIFAYGDKLYGCLDGGVVLLDDIYNAGYGNYKVDSELTAFKKAVGLYHTGGFVGDMTALRSNEEFAKLLKGELVTTPQQMDDFMRKTLPAMVTRASGGGATINNNSPLIEITCGNIDNGTLPQLKDLVDQAVRKIGQNMENALSRTGYRKQF